MSEARRGVWGGGVSRPPEHPKNLSPAPPPPSGVCSAFIQGEFGDYYSQYVTESGVICITRCDARHSDHLGCVHGSCSVGRAGAQCE